LSLSDSYDPFTGGVFGVKRLVDFTSSLWGLMLLSPVFLIITIFIKLDSPGPVFYRGLRAGRLGTPFRMIKFRSMVSDADRVGGPSSPADDPRITRVGLFLRRHKLDELPQLINVLRGEMSLVGPRPEVLEYAGLFNQDEKRILSVRPGITDWASIWNSDEGALLAGSADPEKTYLEKIRPEKIRLQLKYVDDHSCWTDIRILSETIKIVLWRRRAVRPLDVQPGANPR
jgi:lipopolysaccharide/colanic/teichoic acid biosynthesis glycosyltransferase